MFATLEIRIILGITAVVHPVRHNSTVFMFPFSGRIRCCRFMIHRHSILCTMLSGISLQLSVTVANVPHAIGCRYALEERIDGTGGVVRNRLSTFVASSGSFFRFTW